jgi:hypothetical protein
MKDPELVGEFLHCLKIFRVSKQTDPENWTVVEQGMAYLIEAERQRGSKVKCNISVVVS